MVALISDTGWGAVAVVGQSFALAGICWAIAWYARGRRDG
jgi:hypothetical protein